MLNHEISFTHESTVEMLVDRAVAKVDPSRLFDNEAGAEHDRSKSAGHTD